MGETIASTHAKTTKLGVHRLVAELNDGLGATLVAVLAGVRDRALPYKWAKSDGPVPGDESYRRLQAAHRAWTLIRGADDDYVARNWFVGANPRLEEQSPVMRLRDGDVRAVMAAAQAFVDGMDE